MFKVGVQVLLLIAILLWICNASTINQTKLQIITRVQWNARPPMHTIEKQNTPVAKAIIVPTMTDTCTSLTKCSQIVKSVQLNNIAGNLGDIRFHFLIGGNGLVYEGRNWDKKVPYYNDTIVIAYIGNFLTHPPKDNQLLAEQLLLQEGVVLGKLLRDYQLDGHPECKVNIRNDLPEKDAVILSTKGELLAPHGPSLSWKSSEQSILVCSGDRNSFASRNNSECTIKCQSGNMFKVGMDTLKLSDLDCTIGITGDAVKTNKTCANDGTIFDIGFNTKSFGLVKYIEVCYNTISASVIYTNHILRGASVNDSVSINIRPTFKVTGIPPHVKPNSSYKQAEQIKRFISLLGSETIARFYLNTTSFLARGHLAPDNDGVFRSWQHATYFYINVAPQWQVINAGNWLRVENIARKIAAQLADDVLVFTGVYDTLSLPDDNNRPVKLSLEPNNIFVPKFYWKIVKYRNQGIVFITLNNPFAKSKERICMDVCSEYGFANAAFDDFTKGYTYCCTVTDFVKVVNYLPQTVRVETVLSSL